MTYPSSPQRAIHGRAPIPVGHTLLHSIIILLSGLFIVSVPIGVVGQVVDSSQPIMVDGGIPWEKLEEHLGETRMKMFEGAYLRDLSQKDMESQPDRTVMQWIEGTFYRWDEFVSFDKSGKEVIGIRLIRPKEEGLSAHKANVLLAGSELWKEQSKQDLPVLTTLEPSDFPDYQLNDAFYWSLDGGSILDEAKSGGFPNPVTDPRIPLSGETQKHPNRYIGYVSTYGEVLINGVVTNRDGRGSGIMVSNHTVLTCGHNLYNLGTSSYQIAAFFPGQNETPEGIVERFYDPRVGISVPVHPNWPSYSANDQDRWDHDLGAIQLTASITGLATFPPVQFGYIDGHQPQLGDSIKTIGYPSRAGFDNCTATSDNGGCSYICENWRQGQWKSSGTITSFSDSQRSFFSNDTFITSGNSGGPVFSLDVDGQPHRLIGIAVAVHVDNVNNCNHVKSIVASLTQMDVDLIEEWVSWIPGQHLAPPPNNKFANAALVLSASGSVSGTTAFATIEAAEFTKLGLHNFWRHPWESVWYRWDATSNGTLNLVGCGNRLMTVGVLEGVSSSSSLESLLKLTDPPEIFTSCSSGERSFAVNVVQGRSYWIRIAPFSEDNYYLGEFNLSWNFVPTGPALSVSPSSHNFGSVSVGSTAQQTFTITNNGTQAISGTATTSSPFSIISGGAYTLQPGQEANVTVRFSPQGSGSFEDSLNLSGAGGMTVPLSGTGGGSTGSGLTVIAPSTHPLDGTVFKIEAILRDGNGNPVPGHEVTFERSLDTLGGWANADGSPRQTPNNGPTDSSGSRITYYKPNTEGTMNFTVHVGNLSRQFNVTAMIPSTGLVGIGIGGLYRSSGQWRVEAEAGFATTNENSITNGTARLEVNPGFFVGSSNYYERSLGSSGNIYNVYGYGNNDLVTLTGSIIGTSIYGIENFYLPDENIPSVNSTFSLTDDPYSRIESIVNHNNKLYAKDSDTTLTVWDMRSWTVLKRFSYYDYSSSQRRWFGGQIASISQDGGRILYYRSTGDWGIINTSNGSVVGSGSFDSFDYEHVRADIHPNGNSWVLMAEIGSPRSLTVTVRGINGSLTRTLLNVENSRMGHVKFSPDGTRLAVVYRSGKNSGLEKLRLYDTSSWTVLTDTVISCRTYGGGGISWHQDSSGFALGSQTVQGSLMYLDRSGNSIADYTRIPLFDHPTTVEMNPVKNIASVMEMYGTNAIVDLESGRIVKKIIGPSSVYEPISTMSWSENGNVLAITDRSLRNGRALYLFAPFDTTPPELFLNAEFDGLAYNISIVATDDTSLHPNSLRTAINQGAMSNLWLTYEEDDLWVATHRVTPTSEPLHISYVLTDLAGNTDEKALTLSSHIRHPLSLDIVGQGSIEVNEHSVELPYTNDFSGNVLVLVSAIPAPGWQFSHWSGSPPSNSASTSWHQFPSHSFRMDEPRSSTAHFVLVPTPTPSPTPTASPSPTPTETPTPSPTPSPTPTVTPTPTASPTVTPTPTPLETVTPSPTPTDIPTTPTVTSSPTPTVTSTPTASPTVTPTPTPVDTVTPSPTPTDIPTTPTVTSSPTPSVTTTPTASPTVTPTPTPVESVTPSPTPTDIPTTPTVTPSPTMIPTITPTVTPTPVEGAEVHIIPESHTVQVNRNFNVAIRLRKNEVPAAGGGFHISFDHQALEFVEGSTNRAVFNSTAFTSDPNEVSPGVISFPAFATSTVEDAEVLVATLTFRGLESGSTRFDFLTGPELNTHVTNHEFDPLPTHLYGGSVMISAFCPGDANRDGVVNLNDFLAVRDHFGQTSATIGDANGDGVVNLQDYITVRDNFGRICE